MENVRCPKCKAPVDPESPLCPDCGTVVDDQFSKAVKWAAVICGSGIILVWLAVHFMSK